MDSVETIAGARAAVAAARGSGQRIAFVPTMGYLHEGHLSLVDKARSRGGCVVMSIFVNPTQFGPGEDYTRYPRDLARDSDRARARGVDLLFVPATEELYPSPPSIRVTADDLSSRWEGEIRPGHFAGVLTVVAKLFNIVRPDVAVFGRKDYQQATLVRRMVRELDFPVEIVVAPTVRESDGLAMSSRNTYLSARDRRDALALVASLRAAAAAFSDGERSGEALTARGRAVLDSYADVRPDYFAIVDPDEMRPVERVAPESIAIVAARVGATRLIDNIVLGEGV